MQDFKASAVGSGAGFGELPVCANAGAIENMQAKTVPSACLMKKECVTIPHALRKTLWILAVSSTDCNKSSCLTA